MHMIVNTCGLKAKRLNNVNKILLTTKQEVGMTETVPKVK
jgi:hypothetical protein